MGEGKQDAQVDFDTRIRLEFHGSNIISDAGLIAYRELEDALELTTAVENSELKDSRTGKNTRHTLTRFSSRSGLDKPFPNCNRPTDPSGSTRSSGVSGRTSRILPFDFVMAGFENSVGRSGTLLP